MKQIESKNTRILLSLTALFIIIYSLQAAAPLLIPFLLAIFLALITLKPMFWLQSKKIPGIFSAFIIVAVIMLLLLFIASILGTSIVDFTNALPSYQARLDLILEVLLESISNYISGDQSKFELNEIIDPGWIMGLAASLLNALRDVLTNTFLIMFTMIFILLEASSFEVKLLAAFNRKSDSFERQKIFIGNLGRYLGIKTLVSIATGITVALVTSWIGLDFPLLWGMFAFLLNYVPTIGSIIAAVPAILMALIQLGIGDAVTTAISFFVINLLFGSFIEPKLLGYGVGLSPLVVFISLFFWGWIFGPVGMILSVPLTMALKMALESDEETKWLAIIIGSEDDALYKIQAK
ncbi:MAG: AI-2E family transporter [Pseudomonadota bacterium]|nr:AI-2E family transporter [Pseudomonadota bacterium]